MRCIVCLARRFSGGNEAQMIATCAWQRESLKTLNCLLERHRSVKHTSINTKTFPDLIQARLV